MQIQIEDLFLYIYGFTFLVYVIVLLNFFCNKNVLFKRDFYFPTLSCLITFKSIMSVRKRRVPGTLPRCLCKIISSHRLRVEQQKITINFQ